MPVELLIAPPASGKTKTCLHRIKSVQSTQPLAKVWVLVPDRKTAAYFRQRLAESGGGMGISVGTYRDLYREILERCGNFTPVITPALEYRLVQETVDTAFEAGELTHYASIRQKPGFILALQDCFAELRIALVRPDRFLEYAQRSTPARHELAILYARFLTRLQELNWIDQEGQAWLAISALESNPRTATELRLVVADGFPYFTGALRKFLKLLSEQVGEVLITLPGKAGSTRPVHRRSQAVMETLQRELNPKVIELDTTPRLPPASLHLEKHILDPGEFEKQKTLRPILIEARSQSEEAREALRWIKELNKREHLPLNACAVYTSNLETYQPLLRAVANETGIKVHFSHSDPLVESPAVLAVLSLLSLPGKDYRTRDLLNTLHSPYFDPGLDGKAIEDLEKVSQEACIVMGQNQWEDAWKRLEKTEVDLSDEMDEERRRDDLTAGIDLSALREALDKFWNLFDPIMEVRSQKDWIAWLEGLLERLHFYEKITSERDREACSSLGDALKALVMSESVVGIRRVDYSHFLSDLQGALNGAVLDEPKETRRGALVIGGMIEARASRFKAVALLGFSEGLFPAVENADPFLDEEMRRDLGLESRLQREQASIFYQAFTRTDEHLLMTRPYLSEDGEPWEPSTYWLSAEKLLAKESLLKTQAGKTRLQADAASPQELLFWGIQQNNLAYPEDNDLALRWQALASAREILSMRRSKRAHGAYEGYVDQLAPMLAGKYSAEHTLSASRLEQYGTCPHQFYIQTVLKLIEKEPPELGLNAAQMGNINHRILELVYQNAKAPRDIQSLLDKLEEVAARVFLRAPAAYGFRPSPLWEVEKAQYLETLRVTIRVLEEKSPDWSPIRFEQKFGIENNPALEIDLGTEKIHLRGLIDRVDKNSSGQIRVIDYKTGGGNLEKADLRSGRRLQLPIYALAAQDALQLGKVVEGFYWVINQAEPSSLKLSNFETDDAEGPEAAYAMVTAHIKRMLEGIRSGEFPPRPPRGGCPKYCPAGQWCWRYHPGNQK